VEAEHAGADAVRSSKPDADSVDAVVGMSGLHAGVIVFVGVAFANAGNALFHLIAGRWLGPSSYGELASLLALLGLVAFPLAAVQLAIAREVAQFRTTGQPDRIRALYQLSIKVGLLAGVILAILLGLAMFLARGILDVDDSTAIVLTAIGAIPAVFAPIVAGLAQGLERFVVFSLAQFIGPALRILLLLLLLAAGFGVSGAVGAGVVSSVATVLVVMWLLREWWPPASSGLHVERLSFLRSLSPIVVGILAFTSLTTIDVVVAKIVFTGDEAGIYGAASLVGRLILYLPAAIVSVLLPKVSSRAAVGRSSTDILIRSTAATAVLCVAATILYAVAPTLLLRLAFGEDYTEGADLLWMFGVAMTGYALLNVVFVYRIAHHEWFVSLLLAAGALAQLAAFALFHESPRELLVVSIAFAYGLLAIAVVAPRTRRAGHTSGQSGSGQP
jgi:O-antigen/teichoic acid export membrane protein